MILSTSKAGRLALFSCAIFVLIFFICSCRAVDLTSRFSDPTPTKGSGLLYSFQFSIFRDCRYHLEIRKIHSAMRGTGDHAEQRQPPASLHLPVPGSCSSSAPAAGTAGRKRKLEKTPDEIAAKRAAHRVHCKEYREREKANKKKTQEENKKMKTEQENLISNMQSLRNEIQDQRKTVEGLKERLMGPIPLNLEINGQKFRNLNELSDWLTSQTYDQNYKGVVDYSGAASSYANNDDLNNWINEMLCSDNALVAGIIQTENNLEVENQNQKQNNEVVNRTDQNPVQRNTENKRDEQPILELNLEIERLRNVEAKYQEIAPLIGELQGQLKNVEEIICQLAEESKRRNDTEPYLARKIREAYSIVRQHVQDMVDKSFDPVMYTEEYAQNFMEKLDANEKSAVDFKDFHGLEDELERSGRLDLPHSLVPVDELLKKYYGDITVESNQIPPVIRTSYILFCSVIKEMGQLQLEQLDLSKMILWRDAINSGLSIGFKASFAIQHLKGIARAYFAEMQMCHYDLHGFQFQGKPLTSGLFLS